MSTVESPTCDCWIAKANWNCAAADFFFSKSEGTYIFSFHVGADKIMLISDILSSWASLLVWMTLGLSFFHHWAEAWNCCYHSFQSNRISTSPESNVYFSEKSDLPFYSKRKFYTAYTSMNYKSRPFQVDNFINKATW